MAVLPLVLMGLGTAAKGVGAIDSYSQQRKAQRQLDALGRQALPQYAVNPAVARIYAGAQREVASPEGFTGAERNAFMQNSYTSVITIEYPITVISSLLGRCFIPWALWLKNYDIV